MDPTSRETWITCPSTFPRLLKKYWNFSFCTPQCDLETPSWIHTAALGVRQTRWKCVLPCVVQKHKSIPSQPAAVAMGPLVQTENNWSCRQTTTLPRWEKQIHGAVTIGLALLVHQYIRSICEKENLTSKSKTHCFVVPRESLWAVPKSSLPSAYQPRDDWQILHL